MKGIDKQLSKVELSEREHCSCLTHFQVKYFKRPLHTLAYLGKSMAGMASVQTIIRRSFSKGNAIFGLIRTRGLPVCMECTSRDSSTPNVRTLALSAARQTFLVNGVVEIGDTQESKFVFTREVVNAYKKIYGNDETSEEEEDDHVPTGALFWYCETYFH